MRIVERHEGGLVEVVREREIGRQTVVGANERGWYDDPVKMDYTKEIKKNILSPYWGIWCTSWCRFTLLTTVHKLTMAGVKVLYCDTDSIKYVPCHKATHITVGCQRRYL